MGKSVPSSIYTKDYYLSDCTGYTEFLRSNGNELDPRLTKLLPLTRFLSGQSLLDIGCGRGEVVLYAAHQGLTATGIDYAKDAIELALAARQQQNQSIKAKTHFEQMDAKKLKFPARSFDWVIMTDVVEHLYPDELTKVYREVHRVLKPNGTVLIHTEPNRRYNDFTYPFYCYPMATLLVAINTWLTGRRYPGLPHPSHLRTASHKLMHINEATYESLAKQLKQAGFKPQITTTVTILKPILSWKDTLFNRLVCLDPWSKSYPFNTWFADDFMVVAKKNI